MGIRTLAKWRHIIILLLLNRVKLFCTQFLEIFFFKEKDYVFCPDLEIFVNIFNSGILVDILLIFQVR